MGKHHDQDEEPEESVHVPWYRRLIPVRVKVVETPGGDPVVVGTAHARGGDPRHKTMWPFGHSGRTVSTEDDADAAE